MNDLPPIDHDLCKGSARPVEGVVSANREDRNDYEKSADHESNDLDSDNCAEYKLDDLAQAPTCRGRDLQLGSRKVIESSSRSRSLVNAAPPRRYGIATEFCGIRFRSRLEANWAAFFQLLGLKADYEPTDLNFYIPDFDLRFKKRPLLVEIKPSEEHFEQAQSKIECSGWDGDMAILVSGLTGELGMSYENGAWDTCVLAWCTACNSPTITQESGDWSCRNCGAGRRAIWFGFRATDKWNEAKNLVQWKAAG
jgi:hypothetical protein